MRKTENIKSKSNQTSFFYSLRNLKRSQNFNLTVTDKNFLSTGKYTSVAMIMKRLLVTHIRINLSFDIPVISKII